MAVMAATVSTSAVTASIAAARTPIAALTVARVARRGVTVVRAFAAIGMGGLTISGKFIFKAVLFGLFRGCCV